MKRIQIICLSFLVIALNARGAHVEQPITFSAVMTYTNFARRVVEGSKATITSETIAAVATNTTIVTNSVTAGVTNTLPASSTTTAPVTRKLTTVTNEFAPGQVVITRQLTTNIIVSSKSITTAIAFGLLQTNGFSNLIGGSLFLSTTPTSQSIVLRNGTVQRDVSEFFLGSFTNNFGMSNPVNGRLTYALQHFALDSGTNSFFTNSVMLFSLSGLGTSSNVFIHGSTVQVTRVVLTGPMRLNGIRNDGSTNIMDIFGPATATLSVGAPVVVPN